MLVNGSISSFINGVSQQPINQRLPSQGTLQENAVSSPADGLGKRPPTEHVAWLLDEQSEWPKVHFIDRDENEKYVVVFHGNRPRVYDLTGKRYPVYSTVAYYDYLTCDRPSRDLACLSLADETIVVNRTKIVASLPDKPTPPPNQALIWVRAGNYGSKYTIKLNGHIVRGIETSATEVTDIATDKIAADLVAELSNLPASDWKIQYQEGNSVIWLYRPDNDHFQIQALDSQSGSSLTAIGDTVPRFSDLPPIAPNGMVVKVQGDPSSGSDDYWVKFTTDNGLNDVYPGSWAECPQPGTTYLLDPDTMPHRLVRNQDGPAGSKSGTPYGIWFRFEAISYTPRSVGNDDTSPFPSFVGNKINDVFLHRNRLGFIASSNVVLSRSADFYNFFRSTLLDVQDDDPIDLTLASARVAAFNFALPFAGDLILFGDRTQAILRAGDTLTPKTVSLTVASEYETSYNCKPVGSQSSVWMPYDNGSWGGLREYYVDGTTGQRVGQSVSAHVPRYFGPAVHAAASAANSMLLIADSVNRNKIFVYKWFANGNDRLQSSWSSWTFGDKRIYGFDFIGDHLYIVVERSCGHFLERLDLNRLTDDSSAYVTLLDRRVDDTACTVHYDPSVDWSVITLPYRADFIPVVVTRNGPDQHEGIQLPIEKVNTACDVYHYKDPTVVPDPATDPDPQPPVVVVTVPPDPVSPDPIPISPTPVPTDPGTTPPDPTYDPPPDGGGDGGPQDPPTYPSGTANYTYSRLDPGLSAAGHPMTETVQASGNGIPIDSPTQWSAVPTDDSPAAAGIYTLTDYVPSTNTYLTDEEGLPVASVLITRTGSSGSYSWSLVAGGGGRTLFSVGGTSSDPLSCTGTTTGGTWSININ